MSTAPGSSAIHPATSLSSTALTDIDAERGWRYVRRVLPNGCEIWDTVALTAADLLNPQEGDVMPQRPEHERATRDLIALLEAHYSHDPTYTVFHDLIMDWGIPGLERPSPDIAVVPGVRDPHAIGGRRRYRPIPLDADGLVMTCTSISIRIGLADKQVVIIEAASGARLLTHIEQIDRATEAETRAETEARVR